MTAGIHIVGGDLEALSASVGGVCDGLWGLDVAGAVGGAASAMPGSAISGCRADEDMYGHLFRSWAGEPRPRPEAPVH